MTLSDRDTEIFTRDGALRLASALNAASLGELAHALDDIPLHHAGTRLHGVAALDPFLATSGPVGAVAAAAIGAAARPVRALLFDKTASANWSVPWHQDRTIPVVERVEVAGFGPWTMKSGLLHVAPPFTVLAKMVTLRVHLDAVPETNAPLLIAPGSHRLGQIRERDVKDVVQRCGTAVCEAEPGDIWLYSTPILHASEVARAPRHRRVLQVDFAADDLPGGLTWLGV
ncbi:phytanoyl-CoA dioxygenase family protein [Bradyrhizobium jicamae]|uniref:phytanoyl-CoA dioxygenase family protein n=1 Tax=Bradyrhizobium jicamae TaxID=280332 RepID=UPI001BADF89A|nr:phytanoyl-CoA dioxygenase family protein [Bradyrhizobium jicamae]MBR0751415.1 phytanoyl-CoA dioxygenase family protein [Bradyrhizobium jicamae]